MAQQKPARRKMQAAKTPFSIPDKLYFRIGDVSRLCTLPAYVLRFWETEFSQLKPNKGGTGQRLYRKRDVEMVLEIKHLLYDEGFTIVGARRMLAEKRRTPAGSETPVPMREVKEKSIRSGERSDVSDRTSSKASKTLLTTPLPVRTKTPDQPMIQDRPKIKALRDEMRELLALLGSDTAEQKPPPMPAKRDTKKARRADEPTLF